MGFAEVEKYFLIAPDELSEEDKENLFPDVSTLQLPPNIEPENLIKLFQLAQEILRLKGEQVFLLITHELSMKIFKRYFRRSNLWWTNWIT